jgi:hypothetical protein
MPLEDAFALGAELAELIRLENASGRAPKND